MAGIWAGISRQTAEGDGHIRIKEMVVFGILFLWTHTSTGNCSMKQGWCTPLWHSTSSS